MPYRRLPNTDQARLRALKKALEKGMELPPFKLAFSQKTKSRLQFFIDGFENSIAFYKQAYSEQTKKNREYIETVKKAKLYISHFIQVINMAILRGEHSPAARLFYGIDRDNNHAPILISDNDIIQWGKRLIEGETERVNNGGSPVMNPSIALVRVRYEKFIEAHFHQTTLKKNNSRARKKLVEMRKEADEIILNIWNEVENSYKDLPAVLKREKAREYGLVYVYRKNELEREQSLVNQESNTG